MQMEQAPSSHYLGMGGTLRTRISGVDLKPRLVRISGSSSKETHVTGAGKVSLITWVTQSKLRCTMYTFSGSVSCKLQNVT